LPPAPIALDDAPIVIHGNGRANNDRIPTTRKLNPYAFAVSRITGQIRPSGLGSLYVICLQHLETVAELD
jgi:hypothetical protein